MKNILPIALVCIALGFAGGWFAKPDASPTDNATAENARSSTRSESRATAKPNDQARASSRSSVTAVGDAKEIDPETQKIREEAQKKQRVMVRNKMKKQYDLRISAMVRELGLNPEQEKTLRAFYDQQLEKLSSLDPEELMKNPEGIKDLAATMRGDGLNDFMKETLTAEQQESLVAMQERQYKNKIEGRAMKTLAKLQQSLDLTGDQEDQAYAILSKDAEKQVAAQTDEDYVMRSYLETMGMGDHMGDDDLGSIFKVQQAAQNKEGLAAVVEQMKNDRKAEADRKVELMAPVLNEGQLKQYRGQLENQGGMIDMMLQGMESRAGAKD